MATITSLGASDDGATSRTTINTNFTNLNTDKIEAASSDTLTNKSINSDNNTITNIATTDLKSPTGSDTNVVTGTAGTSGNLVKWDANGDAVDATVAVDTDGTLAGNSDSSVPTEKAVKTYVDARPTYGTMSVEPSTGQGSTGVIVIDTSTYFGAEETTATNSSLSYIFLLPPDATSIVSAQIAFINTELSTYTPQVDIRTAMAGDGEQWDTHTETALNVQLSELASWEVGVLEVGDYLTNATGGDFCHVSVANSNAGGQDLGYGPMSITYTV